MAATTELYRGMIIKFNNEPHVLIEKEFRSMGKGAAFNRVRLQNIKTRKFFETTFKSGEKVEELDVETRNMIFGYLDGNNVVFMDPETYEQTSVPMSMIPNGTDYLHSDAKYIMTSYEGEVIYVQLPQKITLQITETTDATKGNTVNNALKDATVETGAVIQVPMFIKNGDRIIINTETGSYFSKE